MSAPHVEPFILTGEIEPKVTNNFLTLAAAGWITDLVISSPGGDIGLMFGMYDVIRILGINTHVVGLAQSAAAVLAQAGKKRTMTNCSLLQFHAPAEHATDCEFRLYTQLAEMVSQRTGMHITDAHGLFDDKFITPNRAIELGLADSVSTDNPTDPFDVNVLEWMNNGRRN